MAKLSFSFLFFLWFVLYIDGMMSVTAVARGSNPTDFIKLSCRATRYPKLCVQSLSGYANSIRGSDLQLARTALSVSLARARSAADFVVRLGKTRGMNSRVSQAVKDCIQNMGDSVDRLSKSIVELDSMNQAAAQDFIWHMSNVQTWASAALTNENTCTDGFSGRLMEGNVKVAIRQKIASVAQATSNALALVNRFAERCSASGPGKP